MGPALPRFGQGLRIGEAPAHGFQPFELMQIVEVGRLLVNGPHFREDWNRDFAADGASRFIGLVLAGLAGPAVGVGAEDKLRLRILGSQHLRDGQEVSAVERHDDGRPLAS